MVLSLEDTGKWYVLLTVLKMASEQSPIRRRQAHRRWPAAGLALALLLSLAPATAPSAGATEIADGQLWLLPQYIVPGCEPMPRVPTVFNFLVRKALAVQEFMATSADCGQVGRRGTTEGWTYVFWSESDETAVAGLLRKAREKFGLTQLLLKGTGEAHRVRAKGYEAFFLIQLGGDQGPVRVWSAGDVASLEATIAVLAPGELELTVESVTHDGNRCVSSRRLEPSRTSGPREALPCR